MIDAARASAFRWQHLHNVVSGKSAVTPELAIKLEVALGSSADTWLRMQNAHDLARVQQRGGGATIERFTPACAFIQLAVLGLRPAQPEMLPQCPSAILRPEQSTSPQFRQNQLAEHVEIRW